MNVLLVTRDIDVKTGTGLAERTRQLANAFAKAGDSVTVLALAVGQREEFSFGAVRLVLLPCINRRYFVPFPKLFTVYRLVKNADVICLMGFWSVLNTLVARFCVLLGKPFTVSPAGEWCAGARSQKIKWVFETALCQQVKKKAELFVAITAEEKSEFIGKGISEDKIIVVPNGVEQQLSFPTLEELTEKYKLPKAPFVLFLGRLNWVKGPDLLLRAYSEVASTFPGVNLVFAGPDDGLLAELQRETEKTEGLEERVHFVGFVEGDDRFGLLKEAELLVIPSRREMMSIVVLEAGICQTPVLLTDVCGFDEIEDIKGGKVCAPCSRALAQNLRELLSDSSSGREMGRRLKSHVSANYLWQHAGGKLRHALLRRLKYGHMADVDCQAELEEAA